MANTGNMKVSKSLKSDTVVEYTNDAGITIDGIKIIDNTVALPEITTPSAIENYGKIYTKSDNNVYFQDGAGVEHVLAGRVDFKSYALATPGIAGTRYIGGFYQAPAAHSVLNQGALTQTYGTALRAKGAHAFLVASAAGTATGGSGAVTIVVSGVSITSAGVRNDADSEVIVADITAMSTDAYYETTKRWLGQVTYTLTVGATGHTAYAATFNYGFAKYDDFGNRNFVVTDFDLVVTGGATDNGFDVSWLFIAQPVGYIQQQPLSRDVVI